MTSIDLVIAGMTCSQCTARVTRALRAVVGVGAVEVDLKAGTAHVKADSSLAPLNGELLILSLLVAGYSARILHSGAPHLYTAPVNSGCCCKS